MQSAAQWVRAQISASIKRVQIPFWLLTVHSLGKVPNPPSPLFLYTM